VWDALRLHDVLDRVLILNEGDDPHLCFTLGTLKPAYLRNSLFSYPSPFKVITDCNHFDYLRTEGDSFRGLHSVYP
jgi:hypothetical protein